MKFDCGRTIAEWIEARENWHDYFALIPRRISSHDCRWLEVIERKGSYVEADYSSNGYWEWEYRAKS